MKIHENRPQVFQRKERQYYDKRGSERTDQRVRRRERREDRV